jgi:hypothetical protein
MKTQNSIVSLAACVAIVTFAGCSKSNESTLGDSGGTNAAPPAASPVATVTDAAKDMAGQAVAATTNAVDATTSQFTAVVANAKQFIADKNYQGALDELKKISSLQLSAEQQKIVDDLKAEATKLLSGGAAGAVNAANNLLGK